MSLLDDVFFEALERPADDRVRFVRERTAGDPSLRREVLSLLAAHGNAEQFLETPALVPALTSSAALVPGTMLSHYRIERRLGSGGMGVVYLARDLATDRNAAVKVLHPGLRLFDDSRLAREGAALARLQHPSIATFYDSGRADETAFIGMEYVEGDTLAERLLTRQVPSPASMALALLNAVSHAHAAGVLHLDIKPGNIMLTGDERLKLLDFGVARLFDSHLGTGDDTSTLLGTAGYAPPEQLKGDPVDERTDLFAAGAVIYEMFSGQAAFGGDNRATRVARTLDGTVPERPESVPARVYRVLARSLSTETSARFSSARDFVNGLREAIETHAPVRISREKGEWHRRAMEAFNRGGKDGLEEARHFFQLIVAGDPNDAEGWSGLGRVTALRFTFTTSIDDVTEAIAHSKRALELDPTLVEPYLWIAYSHIRRGESEEGYRAALLAAKKDTKQHLGPYLAGCYMSSVGKPSEAIPYFAEAVAREATYGWAEIGHGWSLIELDDVAGALPHLERAVECEAPEIPFRTAGAGGYLGECLRQMKRHDNAWDAARQGVEAVEGSDFVYRDTFRAVCLRTLALVSLDRGDRESASTFFNRIVAHITGRPLALGGGHLYVQAMAGRARVNRDGVAFAEATDLFERRHRFNFSWIWSCTDDVTLRHLELAAEALDRVDQAAGLRNRIRTPR